MTGVERKEGSRAAYTLPADFAGVLAASRHSAAECVIFRAY